MSNYTPNSFMPGAMGLEEARGMYGNAGIAGGLGNFGQDIWQSQMNSIDPSQVPTNPMNLPGPMGTNQMVNPNFAGALQQMRGSGVPTGMPSTAAQERGGANRDASFASQAQQQLAQQAAQNPYVTSAMVAANPGAYTGTAYDPARYVTNQGVGGATQRLANNPATPDANMGFTPVQPQYVKDIQAKNAQMWNDFASGKISASQYDAYAGIGPGNGVAATPQYSTPATASTPASTPTPSAITGAATPPAASAPAGNSGNQFMQLLAALSRTGGFGQRGNQQYGMGGMQQGYGMRQGMGGMQGGYGMMSPYSGPLSQNMFNPYNPGGGANMGGGMQGWPSVLGGPGMQGTAYANGGGGYGGQNTSDRLDILRPGDPGYGMSQGQFYGQYGGQGMGNQLMWIPSASNNFGQGMGTPGYNGWQGQLNGSLMRQSSAPQWAQNIWANGGQMAVAPSGFTSQFYGGNVPQGTRNGFVQRQGISPSGWPGMQVGPNTWAI